MLKVFPGWRSGCQSWGTVLQDTTGSRGITRSSAPHIFEQVSETRGAHVRFERMFEAQMSFVTPKITVAPWEYHGMSRDHDPVKRLHRRQRDALKLEPSFHYPERMRLSIGLDRSTNVVSASQFGQKGGQPNTICMQNTSKPDVDRQSDR